MVRRFFILPLWLTIMLLIVGAGLYLGYRAPDIVAAVLVVTAAVAGWLAFVAEG